MQVAKQNSRMKSGMLYTKQEKQTKIQVETIERKNIQEEHMQFGNCRNKSVMLCTKEKKTNKPNSRLKRKNTVRKKTRKNRRNKVRTNVERNLQ